MRCIFNAEIWQLFSSPALERNEAEDPYLCLTLGWYLAGIIFQSPVQCN